MTLAEQIKALPAIKDEAGAECVSREVVLGLVAGDESTLRDALAGVMSLIETNQLVRNTLADSQKDWHVRMIKFVKILADAQAALQDGERHSDGSENQLVTPASGDGTRQKPGQLTTLVQPEGPSRRDEASPANQSVAAAERQMKRGSGT